MIKRVYYKGVFFHYNLKNQHEKSILFFHGLGGTSYSFKEYFYLLNDKESSFFAPDHPFHGKTDLKDFKLYIDIIFQFLLKNKIQKVKIVSHSFGSFITELFNNRYSDSVEDIMLITPFIEAKKQTKGFGLFLYNNKNFFKLSGKLLSLFPEKFKYPDYSKIHKKPYYAYWINDMTHCDRKGYFDIQYFISDRKPQYPDYLKKSDIILGRYDLITYCDLTLKLLKGYEYKSVKIYPGDHLFPLKEFKFFKDDFLNFIYKNDRLHS